MPTVLAYLICIHKQHHKKFTMQTSTEQKTVTYEFSLKKLQIVQQLKVEETLRYNPPTLLLDN